MQTFVYVVFPFAKVGRSFFAVNEAPACCTALVYHRDEGIGFQQTQGMLSSCANPSFQPSDLSISVSHQPTSTVCGLAQTQSSRAPKRHIGEEAIALMAGEPLHNRCRVGQSLPTDEEWSTTGDRGAKLRDVMRMIVIRNRMMRGACPAKSFCHTRASGQPKLERSRRYTSLTLASSL